MGTSLSMAITPLSKGSTLRLQDAQGRAIAVYSGLLWITQERDPRDFTVGAGETFLSDRPGLTIVQAIEDARLLVFDTGATPARQNEDTANSLEVFHQARRLRAAAVGGLIRRAVSHLWHHRRVQF